METNVQGKAGVRKVIKRGLHGLYVSLPKTMKIDGRSKFGKAILQLRTSLTADLGSDISTQESLIVDRVVFKVLRLCSFEAFILKDEGGTETEKQGREYLAMANSLRLDLQALGLERREQKIEDLQSYLNKNYPQVEEENEKAG